MEKAKYKISLISKATTFVLLTSGVLSIYGFPIFGLVFSFGFIFTTLIGLIYVGRLLSGRYKGITGVKKNVPIQLIVLYVYYLTIRVITAHSLHEVFQVSLSLLAFFMMFAYFGLIKYDYLIKLYRKLGVVFIAFFLFQNLFKFFFGYFPAGVATWLPLAFDGGGDFTEWYQETYYEATRCASFFSEPAHFAQWLGPLLCIELFNDNPKYWKIIIIIICLLLLQSGNAMFVLAVVGVAYTINLILKRTSMLRKILSFLLVLTGLVFIGWYARSEIGESVMNRGNALVTDTEGNGEPSGFTRIVQGYYIWNELSPKDKLFGCGSEKSVANYAKNAFGVAPDNVYLNGVQSTMIYTGLVGVVITISLIFALLKNNNILGRSSLFLWFVLSFMSSIFFGSISIVCWFLAFQNKRIVCQKKISNCQM